VDLGPVTVSVLTFKELLLGIKMRKLFYIPVVHTPEDLGSHLEEVKKHYVTRHGIDRWREHTEELEKFWRELRSALLSMPIDYTKLKLYQDSLPVCGSETKIVKELAQSGNRNYQILLELMNKGAKILGTEDPKLLIEERERLKERTAVSSYDDLMERRDKYIAKRIDITLKEGEIGLLLIGALHRVESKLPDDIEIRKSLHDLKESI
jgi:hypothetical protein